MKTQKILFRYFTLAIGFSMLSSSVLANKEMESFSLLKSNNKYSTLQKKALENTEAAIPAYKANFYDTSIGSPYAKLSYLMISTFPGECKAGANYDLTNVPGKTFGKYTMKPVCAQFKSVAADIVDAREAFFNSIPEVKEFYKQEALAKKEKEEKASEPETIAKTPTSDVITLGAAPSIDKPTSQVAAVEAEPVNSVVATTGGGKRNSIGLLPGDKGFDPKDPINAGRSCNPSTTSRTVNDRMICYETEEELAAAVRGEGSIEGKNMLAIQNQKAINEKKKNNYNEGIASGSISFDSDSCIASGNSSSDCEKMKSDVDRKLASTESAVGPGNSDSESTVAGLSAEANGSYIFPGENGEGGIEIPGENIQGIKNSIEKCTALTARQGNEQPQEQTERCEKEEIAKCMDDGICKQMNIVATATAKDINPEVSRKMIDLSHLSAQIELGETNCIDLFTAKKDGVEGQYLTDSVKIMGGADEGTPYFSDRLEGTMYSDSRTCNEIFGSRKKEFTEIKGKLTVKNKVLFCLDALESAKNKNLERCQEAMELLSSGETAVGEKCLTVSDQTKVTEYKQKREENLKYCAEEQKSLGITPKHDKFVEAINGCMAGFDGALGDANGTETIEPRCTAAYNAVKSCLGGPEEGQQWQVALGCASLKGAAVRLQNNEDIDEGEFTYQSIDSVIKCVLKDDSSPVYALDYLACRKSAYWYNTAFITTDLAAPVIGSAMNVYKESDIQGDMQREMASGGVDAQTAALRAQKRQYGVKASAEAVQGTLQGAKAITMFGNMAMYPTPDLVSSEWCLENSENDVGISTLHACGLVQMVKENGSGDLMGELFRNGAMRDVMLKKGFEALSKAIVHGIIAGSYKKRSKLVGEVEKALTDADFNQPENQFEAGPSFCSQNPTLPSCSGTGGGRIVNSGADFSFGGIQPQGGGNLNELDNGDLNGSGSPNNAVRPSGKAKEDLGNILATDSNGKFDKGFKKVGAAKVGAGGGGGGDSGGGGGGASGGGGGGGGGGDSDAKAGAGPQKGFGKKTFGKYIAGSNGKFTSGGSVGGKKKSSNPFAALSGKGRNRKIASQVEKELLPKKVQLFEVISKRYAAVSKDRLDIAKENLLQKDGTK
jgi:hypothetical protein